MGKSTIEWTDKTWNPVRGCSRVSRGCENCYAERMSARGLPGLDSPTTGEPFAIMTNSGPRWTGKVELIERKLVEPLKWRKPCKVFVNSMSDLWHEKLPLRDIARVYAVMRLAHWHTYQVLTKRPENRCAAFNGRGFWHLVDAVEEEIALAVEINERPEAEIPTPWIWEGVSVEDQKTADERIPLLLRTPAAVRFVSAEPLLGPVDFTRLRREGCSGWIDALGKREHLGPSIFESEIGLDLVIVGGESGPGARPMHPDWVRAIRDQCVEAGVPYFFKQWGEFLPAEDCHAAADWATRVRARIIHDDRRLKQMMFRVGKKAAGRLLDGREWNEFPL